jgi:hypothetical protein
MNEKAVFACIKSQYKMQEIKVVFQQTVLLPSPRQARTISSLPARNNRFCTINIIPSNDKISQSPLQVSPAAICIYQGQHL